MVVFFKMFADVGRRGVIGKQVYCLAPRGAVLFCDKPCSSIKRTGFVFN